MRNGSNLAVAIAILVLAGVAYYLFAGQKQPAPGSADAKPAYRVVDVKGDGTASCNKDEQLLSAYCFADQGQSISASGVALQSDANGALVAACLTGGSNLRLFCIPK